MEPGTQLGHYTVLAAIGRGGMGEVCKAKDTKLGREVAIKTLPAEFARDADRLARFEREAKLLASLNHPNIASIYGFEQDQGTHFLVLELVEGPTLADQIAQGPVPLPDSLAIAKQIADALEAAHEAGVIHRDLKPANIKLKPDGVVKVLDFGLAKAFSPTEASPQDPGYTNSPTLSMAATRTGVILGTGAYMAPEQASGKAVDKRADVWAFGVVLYELLTGRRPFEGDDLSLTLAAVMMKEPDCAALPSTTPAAVRRLLRRCLEKDRRKRLADMADVRLEIEEALAAPATESSVAAAVPLARPRWSHHALTAGPWVLVLALGAAWFLTSARTPPPVARPALQFPVELGPDVVMTGNVAFALSPDGTRIAVSERGADQRARLAIRSLDGGETRVLSGTEGAERALSFSVDGEWLGFLQEGKLRKVSVQGGAPVPLCDVMSPRGLSWDADGSIIVAADRLGGLSRCPAKGGALEPLTNLEPGETSHRWPQMLSAADAVLFTSAVPTANDPDANSIIVQRLGTGQRKTLWKGGTYGRYLPSGHLVFVSQNTLFAAPLDLTRLELVGTPRPVEHGVAALVGSDSALFDVSPTGLLAFATEYPGNRNQRTVVRLDSSGVRRPLMPGEASGLTFRFSPDGRRGVLAPTVSLRGLWIYDIERQTRSKLATASTSYGLAWSRDGRYVFFATRDERRDGISVVRADGVGNPIRLIDQRGPLGPLGGIAVSPDGTQLAFGESEGGNTDLWTLPIDLSGDTPRATGEPKVFLSTTFGEDTPAFSKDGHWIAYASDETGRRELFVRPFPRPGGKVQISRDGVRGGNVVWSPDLKELIYVNLEGQLVAVAYTVSGSTFTPGASRRVTAVGPQDGLQDIAPDGKSFAIVTTSDNASAPMRVTFVVNFFDEIRRRLAAGTSQP